MLMEEPFMCGQHTLPKTGNQQYDKQILCSKADLGHCPICDNPDAFSNEERSRRSTGYFSLFVAKVHRANGLDLELNEMVKMQGGFSLIGPIKDAYDAQKMTDETMVGVPFIIKRTGDAAQTRYTIQMKPTMKMKPEGDQVNVEEYAIEKMRSDARDLGYPLPGDDAKPLAEGEEEDPFAQAAAA